MTVRVDNGRAPRPMMRDHGPGMSAGDRKHAADRFFRGESAAGVAGSDFGLAMALTLAERHGATLALDEASGGGTLATTFASAERRQPTRGFEPRTQVRKLGLGVPPIRRRQLTTTFRVRMLSAPVVLIPGM